MQLEEYKLTDRFLCDEGQVAMSGVQALLRALLEQLRADRRAGLNNAALVSGYRGSPLGGVDSLMTSNRAALETNNIQFMPALNEDLGATAVWGSQLANRNFEGIYDGVLGMWYGKAPGVDRSGDAIRHANICGVDPKGGVLLVAGDDPAAKSSTLASASEFAFQDLQTPMLYPGSVQEVADFGRIGYELSRYSGLWSALKIVTSVADAYGTIEVGLDRIQLRRPDFQRDGAAWRHTQEDALVPPNSARQEQEVYEERMEAVRRFVAHNDLNRMTVAPTAASVGIVAAGKTYYDLREALDQLGYSTDVLERTGVRIFKPAVLWPLEPTSLREFASGLEVIIVVEEKRAFLETLIREILYDMAHAPKIFGKRDAREELWFPGHGELDADIIAGALRTFLTDRFGDKAPVSDSRETLIAALPHSRPEEKHLAKRVPNFCSGCPHSRSTWVPEGSEAGGGIGCHGMASMTPLRNVKGITQMGGEGIQWLGAAPFVTMDHRFQNIGDGTYHHSGSLALRQSVAMGSNITYKILYNSAVAMTGGQDVDGGMAVPELTRSIEAEGVRHIIVCTEDTNKYPATARFAEGVRIWHRDRLDEAQRVLRDTPGTTVLIYDQPCAAELRRDRKRGKVPEPRVRIVINEAVCEGCGDCGEKSSCLSVHPVQTEFGRKTQIHQASCNKDFTCVDGECPAFVEVIPAGKVASTRPNAIEKFRLDEAIPEPRRLDEGNVFMVGIGGTGVVTVNQLLATAALLDGKQAHGVDQTGLAQKAGPVVSNMKIRKYRTETKIQESNKIGSGEADAFLVFDLLAATTPLNLQRAQPGSTVAIVSSSQVPTADMVRDKSVSFPEWSKLREALDGATAAEQNIYLDAEKLSESLFGSQMPSNIIVLGAAYQKGVLPVSAAAIERAIDLNGAAVDTNLQAFRLGRKLAYEPMLSGEPDASNATSSQPEGRHSSTAAALIETVPSPSAELLRLLNIRVPDLIDYQSAIYARRYVDFIMQVRNAEASIGHDTRLSETVARYLYKLMAYKDEYEVARLHRSRAFHDSIREQFGDESRISYKLSPPLLRKFGMRKKIGIDGRTADLLFMGLRSIKQIRGTVLDPFGRSRHRRTEKNLIREYQEMVQEILPSLSPATMNRAIEVARLPDMIRGYEAVKERNIQAFRAEALRLLESTR